MKRTILLTMMVLMTLFVAGASVWYFAIPHPPKADITTLQELKDKVKSEDDFIDKVVRWEVRDPHPIGGYDPDKKAYGFLGKVDVTGSSDPIYAGLTVLNADPNMKIRTGDVLYVKTTEFQSDSPFGPFLKGNVLYIEKGNKK